MDKDRAIYNEGFSDGSLSVTTEILDKFINNVVDLMKLNPTIELDDGEIIPMDVELIMRAVAEEMKGSK